MTTELRILTVRQPWAWAIIHGGKNVENRVRNIAGDYRGPVAIHAGAAYEPKANRWPSMMAAAERYGVESMREHLIAYGQKAYRHIIGVVDLIDVHSATGYWTRENEWRLDCCTSSWAETGYTEEHGLGRSQGLFHLELANPRPLAEPIPYRGALGLRRLDVETTAAVWSQIGEKP